MNLDNFDVNENGILDAEELTKWKEMGEAWMKQFGWEFTENQIAELGKRLHKTHAPDFWQKSVAWVVSGRIF